MKKMLFSAIAVSLSLCAVAQTTHSRTVRYSNSNSLATGIIDIGGPCGSTSGQSMVIADWTSGGTPHVWRSYFKFDLSFIDTSATIDTAYLTLSANPTSPSGSVGHPTYGTDNAVGIYRITDAWDTTTLTWGTQPAMTSTHSVTLAQSVSDVEDYTDIDVKALIQDIVASHTNNGVLLKHLQETTPYNSMIFYAPAAFSVDSNKVPRLYVVYTVPPPVGVKDINASSVSLRVYPNPVSDKDVTISVSGAEGKEYTLSVFDITGRMVYSVISPDDKLVIEGGKLSSGSYILKLRDVSGNTAMQKLIVE